MCSQYNMRGSYFESGDPTWSSCLDDVDSSLDIEPSLSPKTVSLFMFISE